MLQTQQFEQMNKKILYLMREKKKFKNMHENFLNLDAFFAE